MGTDSAVTRTITTPSGKATRRILTGYRKVYEIPKIKAGISFWGKGKIGNFPLDVWIPDFIQSHEDEYDNIHDFSFLLQDTLRDLIPELTAPEGSYEYRYGNRGFHLAGYVEYQKQQVPTFYHIHNGQSETRPDINPRIINANHDLPPQKVLELFLERKYPNVRNGDFHIYSLLFRTILNQLMGLRIEGRPFKILDSSKFNSKIEAHSEFVRFWIRLVRDIYALSELPEIIGGDISIISITPNGEITFSYKP